MEEQILITSMVVSIPCELLIACLQAKDNTPETWDAFSNTSNGEDKFQIKSVLNNAKKTVDLTLMGTKILVSKQSTEVKITSVQRLESSLGNSERLIKSGCQHALGLYSGSLTLVDKSTITVHEHNDECPLNTANTSGEMEKMSKPKAKRGRKPKIKSLPVLPLPDNYETLQKNENTVERRRYGLRGVKLSSAIMDAVKGKTYSDDSGTDLEMDLEDTEDYTERTDNLSKPEDAMDQISLDMSTCTGEGQVNNYVIVKDITQGSDVENNPKIGAHNSSYTRYMKNKNMRKCNFKRSVKMLKKFRNSSLAKDQSVDRKKILAALGDVYSNNRRKKSVAKSATCKYCEKRYCDYSGVDIHVRKFHMKEKDVAHYLETLVPLKQVTCPTCNATLPSRLQLQVHEDREHSKVLSQCAICAKVFRNLQFLRNHIKLIHLSDETHLCHLCSATFKHAITLKQHIEEIHEQQRNVTCNVCGKTFYRQAQLNRHSRIHDKNSKKLICQLCGKEFNYECNLQRHVRVVHAPKSENFHCSYCGKGFYQKATMSAHIQKIHFNLCPFLCDLCKSPFMRSKHIEDHMAQIHNMSDFKIANPRERLLKYNRSETDMFPCSYCQENFSYKSSLVDHVQTAHADVFPYHCHHCQQGFLERVFLLRHQEKAHNISPQVWPDDDQHSLEVHLSSETKEVTIVPVHNHLRMISVEGQCIDTEDVQDNVLAVLSSSRGTETISVDQEEEVSTAASVLVEISNEDNTVRYVIQGGEHIDMDSSNTVVHDIASLLLAAEQSLQENSEILALENVDGSVIMEPEDVASPGVITLANAETDMAVCSLSGGDRNIAPSSIGMEEITVIMQE